jgi:hypothetical protein
MTLHSKQFENLCSKKPEFMKNAALIACIILSATTQIFAQLEDKHGTYLNFSGGVASYRGSFSLSYLHNWRIGQHQRIGLGIGARLTSFIGANIYYITAPAELTSGSTGPLVIFKENIDENIDSLLVKSPFINSLNVMVNIDYRLSQKILVGFDIDFIGFSFGGKRDANFISGVTGGITEAGPTPFNILLISDNDRGSLNSELYVKYFYKEKWAAKIGAQFLFTEYTTETPVQVYPEENDRFRNKSLLFSLGMTYKL